MVILLAACGSTTGDTANSPVSSAPPVVDQSPCRIPIAPNGYSAAAGFVSYPDGTFTPDSGAKVLAPAEPGAPDGAFGLTYQRRYAKWLPVPPNWVALDERRYAYGTLRSMANPNPTNLSLHVVDVATGLSKSVAPGDWFVVAFDANGVYVMRQSANAAPSGLSLIDPDKGSIRQITDAGYWTYVAGDAAWGTMAQIPGVQAQPQLDHLIKLDLASGQILSGTGATGGNEAWFTRPGTTIRALGGDNQGHVIVQATSNVNTEFWLVGKQTDSATEIYSGSSQGTDSLNSVYALGDAHGVWFGTQSGLYLYPYRGTVSRIAGNPGQVAGTCS